MNCPKCGQKMKKGYLAGGRVAWTPEKLRFCIPPFDDEETGKTIIIPFGFLSRRTFLLQEIFQGLICSKSLKISLFILSSIVSLLVLLK